MEIRINGKEITDAAVEAEIANYAEADRPLDAALRALAIRQIVLDEAASQGIDVSDPERAAAELLDRKVSVRVPTSEECRRHYEGNLARFTQGELVEASHILFQVTPSVDLERLRRKAGQTDHPHHATGHHRDQLLERMGHAQGLPNPQRRKQSDKVAKKQAKYAHVKEDVPDTKLPCEKQLRRIALPRVLLPFEPNQAAKQKDRQCDVGISPEYELVEGVHVSLLFGC